MLAAFGTLSALSAKADSTSEVTVVSYSWYVASSDTTHAVYIGDLVTVGEIQNAGSNTIDYVLLTGVAYDSNEQALAVINAPAYVKDMLPGQKCPFYLDFTPEHSVTQNQTWVDSVSNVAVTVSSVKDTTDTPYSGLTIPEGGLSSYLDSTGTYTVMGTVQNTGGQTANNVWVATTFYNASGTVVALNYTSLSNALAPGDLVRFTATPIDNTPQLSNEIANYSVLIQADPLTTSATPTPPPNSSPTGTQQPTQSTALPSWLIYTALVAIAVVVVVIAALMLLRKRQRTLSLSHRPPII